VNDRNAKLRPLNLQVGDFVEVRSGQEILDTLDERGAVDGLPFMPEMLEFCGKRFRVAKRADKTCDTISTTGTVSRRLYDTVHLEELRCSGEAHGGCQARCFLFWKESWLKRIDQHSEHSRKSLGVEERAPASAARCDWTRLFELTRRDNNVNDGLYYRCQATDLLIASGPLPWWDVRQYVRDVRSGNVGIGQVVKALLFRMFTKSIRVGAYRAQLWLYDRLQSWRGGTPYPFRWGTLEKTPRSRLNLQPGDLVQVKSYTEILQTLSMRNRNLGLRFDAEMVPYCGSIRRVLARVERIIDERTGKMTTLSSDCIILDGVVCRAEYSHDRLFCPRSIYPFWREIWLKRVEKTPAKELNTTQSEGRLQCSTCAIAKQHDL
jgi:hypothetical protein